MGSPTLIHEDTESEWSYLHDTNQSIWEIGLPKCNDEVFLFEEPLSLNTDDSGLIEEFENFLPDQLDTVTNGNDIKLDLDESSILDDDDLSLFTTPDERPWNCFDESFDSQSTYSDTTDDIYTYTLPLEWDKLDCESLFDYDDDAHLLREELFKDERISRVLHSKDRLSQINIKILTKFMHTAIKRSLAHVQVTSVSSTTTSCLRESPLPALRDRMWLISVFEHFLVTTNDELSKGKPPFIKLLRPIPGKRTTLNQLNKLSTETLDILYRYYTCSFTGNSVVRNRRFVIIIIVISYILGALKRNMVISKREIYYQNPQIFVSQGPVNQVVDDLARTLNVPRHFLNVTAAAKGLAIGACSIRHSDGRVSYFDNREGSLIHRPLEGDQIDASKVAWILIVEKEASFRTIALSDIGTAAIENGLVMTAKGYPDISSRLFLNRLIQANKLHIENKSVPKKSRVFALVDLDPDGLAIYLMYKYGSLSSAYQNSNLNIDDLEWLGLRIEQMVKLSQCLSGEIVNLDNLNVAECPYLLPLTKHDRIKAQHMLQREPLKRTDSLEQGVEEDIHKELETMLQLNVKMEIQALDSVFPDYRTNYLSHWLEHELLNRQIPLRSTSINQANSLPMEFS